MIRTAPKLHKCKLQCFLLYLLEYSTLGAISICPKLTIQVFDPPQDTVLQTVFLIYYNSITAIQPKDLFRNLPSLLHVISQSWSPGDYSFYITFLSFLHSPNQGVWIFCLDYCNNVPTELVFTFMYF